MNKELEDKLEAVVEEIELVRGKLQTRIAQSKKSKSESEEHALHHLEEVDEILDTAEGAVSDALAKLRED